MDEWCARGLPILQSRGLRDGAVQPSSHAARTPFNLPSILRRTNEQAQAHTLISTTAILIYQPRPIRRRQHVAASHPFLFRPGGGPASVSPSCGVDSFAWPRPQGSRAASLSSSAVCRRMASLPSANPLLTLPGRSCQAAGRGRLAWMR